MHDFTVLVLEGAYPASVAVTLDILAATKRLAPQHVVASPTWETCSIDGGAIPLRDGVSVHTQKLSLTSEADKSIWIIPGLDLTKAEEIDQRFKLADALEATTAIQRHALSGGTIAASCSAVFLLQAARLLKNKQATTTWWLSSELQKREPDCHVDSDRMVCADGNIITAGAAFAQTDLMLHLIRTLYGNGIANSLTRVLLMDGRQAKAPSASPEVFANGDALVGQLAARIEAAMPRMPSIGELAREFAMSERTLSRHVKRATGKSTLALLQSVKQRRARSLLESSRLTVEQVAEAVGYQDATSLRRLMQRVAGANPSRFRQAAVVSP